jgi:hypothetical protein
MQFLGAESSALQNSPSPILQFNQESLPHLFTNTPSPPCNTAAELKATRVEIIHKIILATIFFNHSFAALSERCGKQIMIRLRYAGVVCVIDELKSEINITFIRTS